MDRRNFLTVTTGAITLHQLGQRAQGLYQWLPQPANPVVEQIRQRPEAVMTLAGMKPDPWQVNLLRSKAETVYANTTRQGGKSLVAGAVALQVALTSDGSTTLIVSPSERQSIELLQEKILPLYRKLGRPLGLLRDSQTSVRFGNGSRIVALPGKEETIRSFSAVSLLILDEAARIPDPLFYSVGAFLAVSHGRMLAMSTPFGQRGWFYEEWRGAGAYERFEVPASMCPRIPAKFLEEERRKMGPRWFAQEYGNSFEAATGSVFNPEDVDAMFDLDDLPEGVSPEQLAGV
jgi:hypothetical protein